MIKRTSLVFVLLACIGGIFWLSRSYKLVRIGTTNEERIPESSASAQATSGATYDGTATAEVPESARHAADEIERHRQSGMAELNKAVREQEEKVAERRKVLATIVRTKGIIYRGPDLSQGELTADGDGHQNAQEALRVFNDLQTQKIQLESQINSLLKYDGQQLITYAAGLDVPENVLKVLHPQYLETQRELTGLKKAGLGESHPTVVTQTEQLVAIQRQMDEGIVSLRATLQAQLQMADDRMNKVEALQEEIRKESIQRGLDAQDYVDAKREYETDQRLLEEMKLKQVSEKMKEKMGK